MEVKNVGVLGSQVFDTTYKTFVLTEYFLYILVFLCLARCWFRYEAESCSHCNATKLWPLKFPPIDTLVYLTHFSTYSSLPKQLTSMYDTLSD